MRRRCAAASIVSTTRPTAPSTARSTSALSPSPISSTSAGSQATTTTLPGQAPSVFTKRSTVCGSMACGLIDLAVLDAGLDLLLERLHHVERPGLTALPADVDQDERVVAAHDLVGEVEPAGAEVEHRRALGQLARLQALDDLAAEAVVLEPRVADARPPGSASSHHLHLGGKEPEKAPVSRMISWPGSSTLDAEVDLAVVVAVDPLDGHRPALEHARLQVGLEARAGPPPARRGGTPRRPPRPRAARASGRARRPTAAAARASPGRAPPRARAASAAPRASRRRRARSSPGPRGPGRSISARSSSLSACTWRTSASSISVLSNRLPRLSGAICGWSGSTIAAPSITSSCGEASTGQVLTLSQGASSCERKRPPLDAQRAGASRSASARWRRPGRGRPGASVRFSTRYETSRRPPLERRLARAASGPTSPPTSKSPAPSIRCGSARWRSPLGARKRTSALTSPPPSTTHCSSRWS